MMNGRTRISTGMAVRALIVFGLIVVGFIAIAVRIFCLQTVLFDFYQKKVVDQLTTESSISPERGNIYDSDGNLLATNITAYRIFISPSSIKSAMEKARNEGDVAMMRADETIADALSSILGVDRESVMAMTKKTASLDTTVARGVDSARADEVMKFVSEHGFGNLVYAEPTDKRYYLYGDLAANVLGFTGSDGKGMYGLEAAYDEELSGTPGKYIIARDSHGNELPYEYESYVDAMDGNSIHTTLNIKLQGILRDQLRATCEESGSVNGGCGIVMNVRTGAVLALAQYPYYDNNDPFTLVDFYRERLEDSVYEADSTEYKNLRAELYEKMWMNYALTNTFIPGSTFKIITSAMGLESGVVSEGESFTCSGSITIAGSTIHCHKVRGHGALTFGEGLQQSCNPILITVGQRLGTTGFFNYMTNFGYFDKTGIDLPGEAGTIFWAKKNFNTVELATAAFGQNFQVSAIRHLTSIAAVANGGELVTPYLVESVTDADGQVVWRHETTAERQVISEDICRQVSRILEEGVSGDGGAKNAYVAGYRVAAKTGTSEKIGSGNEKARIGSCVAYAPAEDPEIAIIIVVDEPTVGSLYGSVVAAPYISKCLSQMLPYLGVEVRYTDEEAARLNVEIGSYGGELVSNAVAKITKLGIQYEVVGVGTVVTAQVPAAGSTLNKENGKVILYVGDTEVPTASVTVPDIVGLTATAANQKLVSAGFNICVEGSVNYRSGSEAVAIAQVPAAGTPGTRGDIVTVTFRFTDVTDD